ncbi:MAG: PRC-barrel domain-containing protein [Actinomycetota bacterium]|nr:PRC-barrel domain-containing protein [Actinomycetota bacterium]
MSERTEQHELVKLSDPHQLRLEDRTQDIRGLDVYGRNGDQIGTVEDLYVDKAEQKVRFLDVGAGDFLGLGEKHFLIPIGAVIDGGENGVMINRNRERVTDSPNLDPNVAPEIDFQRRPYDYYGYPYPGGRVGS